MVIKKKFPSLKIFKGEKGKFFLSLNIFEGLIILYSLYINIFFRKSDNFILSYGKHLS